MKRPFLAFGIFIACMTSFASNLHAQSYVPEWKDKKMKSEAGY